LQYLFSQYLFSQYLFSPANETFKTLKCFLPGDFWPGPLWVGPAIQPKHLADPQTMDNHNGETSGTVIDSYQGQTQPNSNGRTMPSEYDMQPN